MYYKRFADNMLIERLNGAGAVLIRGPKGCGKTETASQVAKSTVLMDTDVSVPYAMELDPGRLLVGAVPRLIDEWQEYPHIWNYVKREVDTRKLAGQFILTGSSTVLSKNKTKDKNIRLHSGSARVSIIDMRPMSLYERKWSTGEVSLENLIQGELPFSNEVSVTLKELVDQLILGGWPTNLNRTAANAVQSMVDYVALTSEVDIQKATEIGFDPLKVMNLMRSYARNISTEASLATLTGDVNGSKPIVVTDTASAYIDGLKRIWVIEDLPAWSTHIRSRDTLRKGPKRHFVDPSLAIGALSLSAERLLNDLQYLGFLFESLVIRDLRIYADVHGGKVYHYRDSSNLEVDAIIEYPDGRWAAFEIKMGFGKQDEGAKNLLRFAQKVNTTKIGEPEALTVITFNGFAYRRKDGVNVVPLGTLTA